MEENKLDKLVASSIRIESCFDNLAKLEEENSERLDKLVEEMYNIKGNLRSIGEKQESSFMEMDKRMAVAEAKIESIQNDRKENWGRILHIIAEIFIGGVLLFIGWKITSVGIPVQNIKHVESNR